MKFLYVDERGDPGSDRFLVHFGLMVDAYKLKKAMREARPILNDVESAFPGALREVKASRLVNGVGGWGKVDATLRKDLFFRLCRFANDVSARAFVYVLDVAAYGSRKPPARPNWASTPWLTGAITLAVLAQRANQELANNKGLSVLIFDDNKVELPALSKFLVTSSDEIDEFYDKPKKADPFDHVVDTAFAIKSEHSQLVQVSDACAFAVRRRAELEIGGAKEAWSGERDFILDVTMGFKDRVVFPTKTWSGNPGCDTVAWIRDVGLPDFKNWMQS